jgi:hypothetical protein
MNEHTDLPLFRPVSVGGVRPSQLHRNLLIQPANHGEPLPPPEVQSVDLHLQCRVVEVPILSRSLEPQVRPAHLRLAAPIVRPFARAGKLQLDVQVQGWKFASLTPPDATLMPLDSHLEMALTPEEHLQQLLTPQAAKPTRQKPPRELIMMKERLLTLLQPPLENLFVGKKIELPFKPFPYQMEGIAFLMPRHGALLADEMGLGKTMQTIVSLRLLLHAGDLRRALVVCPKPLVPNWLNELKLWAPDIPV